MMKRTMAVLLSLLLLLPMAAAAETAESPNMATILLKNIVYTANGTETELPASLEISAGFDAPAMRGAALIRLLTGNTDLTLMGSVENDQLRARLSGVETGVAIPLQKLIDELIIEGLLMGMKYSELSPETLTALDEFLNLLEETLAEPQEAAHDALYSLQFAEDEWKDSFEKYPSLLHAQPAGEEEITLFGKTYPARKYTYSLTRVTEEEFNDFYADFDEYFGYTSDSALESMPADELQQAYDRLNELVLADYEALYGPQSPQNEVWTDDGSFSGSEKGSLSEWSEEQPDDFAYSVEGVLWLVDEVMGIVDRYDFTEHAPDGDYLTSSTQSMMLDGALMRDETVASGTDEYGDRYNSTDSVSVTLSENEDVAYTSFTSYIVDSDDDDYDYRSEEAFSMTLTAARAVIDTEQKESYMGMSNSVAIHSDFDIETDEATDTLTALNGALSIAGGIGGEETTVRMDISMTAGRLPEGELLPLPAKTINPLEADEAEMTAFYNELYARLIQLAGSLFTVPSASAPAAGGALM